MERFFLKSASSFPKYDEFKNEVNKEIFLNLNELKTSSTHYFFPLWLCIKLN